MFPGSTFVFLIRDCYSWLNSFLNYFLLGDNAIANGELAAKMPGGKMMAFDLPHGKSAEKKKMMEHLDQYIHVPIKHWAKTNRYLLNQLPKERTLVVKTHELHSDISRIANFLHVPVDSIASEYAHSHQNHNPTNFFSLCNPHLVEGYVQDYCGDIMAEYFPAYTLENHAG